MSTSQRNKSRNNSGQIAVEFLLVVGISMAVIFIFLAIVLNISHANTVSRTYDDIQDFGKALQQELLLASELEDGYVRELEIPALINGQPYNITIFDATKHTYMIIIYGGYERYYVIPPINGIFHEGKVYLHKNGTLYLT